MLPDSVTISGEGSLLHEFRLDAAVLSAPRLGRLLNEDHYVFSAPGAQEAASAGVGYLFALADGSSAGGRGGLAAGVTVETIQSLLFEERARDLRPGLLELELYDANERVSGDTGGQSTATGTWLWEGDDGDLHARWAHVGDTRLYHRSGSDWTQLPTDHSLGRGLARAIGGGAGLFVERGELELRPNNLLVLVSDGVWKRACPAAAGVIDACTEPSEAVRTLVGQVRFNGSQDDATAIALRVTSR